MNWRKVGSRLWEFVSISMLSLAVGIGVGFWQGTLSCGSELGDIRMALPNEGALTGALFGLPAGWIAYYLILKRQLSFRDFRNSIAAIFLAATLLGWATGYFSKGEAALAAALLMVPISITAIGFISAHDREKTRNAPS